MRPRSHFKTLKAAAVWNARFPGKIAGTITDGGRIQVDINRKGYYAHRLAWLITTGSWPVNELDHKNHIGSDNRLENLREVTYAENTRNRKMNKNNTSGVTGVIRKGGKYNARVQFDGVMYFVGDFATIEEAAEAVVKFRDLLGFHENHGLKVVA